MNTKTLADWVGALVPAIRAGREPGGSITLDELGDVPRPDSPIAWGLAGLDHLVALLATTAPELDCHVAFWLGYRDRPVRNPPAVAQVLRMARQWPHHAPLLWAVDGRAMDRRREQDGYFERITVGIEDPEVLQLPHGWHASFANQRTAHGAVWDRWLNIAPG